MKKLTLIIAIVFSGMLMQAQTLASFAHARLGFNNERFDAQTDYGLLKIVYYNHEGINHVMKVKVSNGSSAHNKILKANDYETKRVGTVISDFMFKIPIEESLVIRDEQEAYDVYNKRLDSPYVSINNAQLFKHKNGKKYLIDYPHNTYPPNTNKWVLVK